MACRNQGIQSDEGFNANKRLGFYSEKKKDKRGVKEGLKSALGAKKFH
jgi:hypothetical protein